MTADRAERARAPGATLHGFAALGTDNLHAAAPPEPDAPLTTEPGAADDPPSWSAVSDDAALLTAAALGSGLRVLDEDVYQRILGEELRELRRRRRWTRKELKEQLPSDISVQTLATYELGSRQCSVVRLVELCYALDELPQDLLARVHQRVVVDEPGHLKVNVRSLASASDPQLAPLRRWGEERLRSGAGEDIQLDLTAMCRMAELCGLDLAEFVNRVRDLGG